MSKFEITVLHKRDGALSKRISLTKSGKIKADGSACRMTRGQARRVKLNGISSLAKLIEPMASDEALALGRLRAGLPDKVRIIRKDDIDDATPAGTIARTNDYIVFAPGKPAYLLLDHDRKGMPSEVRDKLKAAGGFWRAVSFGGARFGKCRACGKVLDLFRTVPQEDRRRVQHVAEQTRLHRGGGRRRHRACTQDLAGPTLVGRLRLRGGRCRRPDPYSVDHRRVGIWS